MTTIAVILTIVMFFLKIIGIPFMAAVGWWTVFMPVIIMVVFWIGAAIVLGTIGTWLISR